MSDSVQVNDRAVLLSLGNFQAGIRDRRAMYNLLGVLMVGSIQTTMRESGSPAGSWVPFALSTLRRKGFKPHKLLMLSTRLFSSIKATIGETLTVGSNLPYARVQNDGSADRKGSIGPQARIAGRGVGAYQGKHTRAYGYKLVEVTGKDGKTYKVPKAIPFGKRQGPKLVTRFNVAADTRFQNIPARPFAVFRPEDPNKLTVAVERYIMQRAPQGGVA